MPKVAKQAFSLLVYWFEISSAVVEKAKAMKDKKQLDKIRSKVPKEILKQEKKSRVAIHHKFGYARSKFEAWASYDVTLSDGEMHFFNFEGNKMKKDKFN